MRAPPQPRPWSRLCRLHKPRRHPPLLAFSRCSPSPAAPRMLCLPMTPTTFTSGLLKLRDALNALFVTIDGNIAATDAKAGEVDVVTPETWVICSKLMGSGGFGTTPYLAANFGVDVW
ncbi:hypothetical protein E4T56_gene19445 [Termitomyces sp. T112]|nr:hypothetical protein E4T56_gene19445 [Termitomyces sp. T112]